MEGVELHIFTDWQQTMPNIEMYITGGMTHTNSASAILGIIYSSYDEPIGEDIASVFSPYKAAFQLRTLAVTEQDSPSYVNYASDG